MGGVAQLSVGSMVRYWSRHGVAVLLVVAPALSNEVETIDLIEGRRYVDWETSFMLMYRRVA